MARRKSDLSAGNKRSSPAAAGGGGAAANNVDHSGREDHTVSLAPIDGTSNNQQPGGQEVEHHQPNVPNTESKKKTVRKRKVSSTTGASRSSSNEAEGIHQHQLLVTTAAAAMPVIAEVVEPVSFADGSQQLVTITTVKKRGRPKKTPSTDATPVVATTVIDSVDSVVPAVNADTDDVAIVFTTANKRKRTRAPKRTVKELEVEEEPKAHIDVDADGDQNVDTSDSEIETFKRKATTKVKKATKSVPVVGEKKVPVAKESKRSRKNTQDAEQEVVDDEANTTSAPKKPQPWRRPKPPRSTTQLFDFLRSTDDLVMHEEGSATTTGAASSSSSSVPQSNSAVWPFAALHSSNDTRRIPGNDYLNDDQVFLQAASHRLGELEIAILQHAMKRVAMLPINGITFELFDYFKLIWFASSKIKRRNKTKQEQEKENPQPGHQGGSTNSDDNSSSSSDGSDSEADEGHNGNPHQLTHWQSILQRRIGEIVKGAIYAMLLRQYLLNHQTPLPEIEELQALTGELFFDSSSPLYLPASPPTTTSAGNPIIDSIDYLRGYLRVLKAGVAIGLSIQKNRNVYLYAGGLLEGSNRGYCYGTRPSLAVQRRLKMMELLAASQQ